MNHANNAGKCRQACRKENTMKATKKILVMVLTLVMLLSCALAEGLIIPKIAVQDMELTSDTAMDLYVYDNAGIKDSSKLTVNIDGTNIDVLGMEAYDKTVSWVFLVDTSVVSTTGGAAPVTGMLKGLIENMDDKDFGVIFTPAATTGRELEKKSALPKDKKGFDKWMAIDEKKTLADGVVGALDFLAVNAPYGRTNLVIISDGNSKGMDALQYTALADTIGRSNTTVYAVALTANPDETLLDLFLNLGESSKGGMGIQVAGQQGNQTVPLEAIEDNEELFKNIHVRVANKLATAKMLTLTANINNQTSVMDTTSIPESVAKYITSSLTIPPVPTQNPTPWIEEHLTLVIIAGGVLLALIAALIIILTVTRKKKNDIVDPNDDPVPPPPVNNEVRITLTREEDGEQFSAVTQGGVCVIGRSSDVDMPLSDRSMKISREHMQLSYENGIVMLQDLGSRNHTYVNNAMVNRKTVMQQGDIIRMGDSEFRISWRQL